MLHEPPKALHAARTRPLTLSTGERSSRGERRTARLQITRIVTACLSRTCQSYPEVVEKLGGEHLLDRIYD